VNGTTARPRLSVFKSNRSIYAQLIDDESGQTLVAVHSREIKVKSGKTAEEKFIATTALGELLAKKAIEKNIKQAVFDRGGYKYHGKIKALADGARTAGLKL
jgi:large subunit ribosomal protein L18